MILNKSMCNIIHIMFSKLKRKRYSHKLWGEMDKANKKGFNFYEHEN